MSATRVVVVGASLAGARTVQGLRDEGFDGEIALIGAEEHLPYDRPPLSKSFLTEGADVGMRSLLDRDEVADLDLQLHLGRRATSLDVTDRSVHLDSGERIRFDALVIATGSRATIPEEWNRFSNVHALRTVEDAAAVRAAFLEGGRVAVVGGGFVGCETAAAARSLGLDVTLVNRTDMPLSRGLVPQLGAAAHAMHSDGGADIRSSNKVVAVEGGDRAERLVLADGHVIDADVIVIGIGAQAETSWLDGSGISLGDGVLCNQRLETSVPGIFAAGDVARWHNSAYGESMRVEHWTAASEQGAFVARSILHGDAAGTYSTVPYVWSDQYGIRIEIAGVPRATDRVHIVEGSVGEGRFVALHERAGRAVAAVIWGFPGRAIRYRRLLAGSPRWEDVVPAPSAALTG